MATSALPAPERSTIARERDAESPITRALTGQGELPHWPRRREPARKTDAGGQRVDDVIVHEHLISLMPYAGLGKRVRRWRRGRAVHFRIL